MKQAYVLQLHQLILQEIFSDALLVAKSIYQNTFN